MKEPKAIESSTAVIGNVHLVYSKSEADRYIAYLKYKRCLAMVQWCDCAVRYTGRLGYKKFGHYFRWHKIWLSLADKFKEAK